MLINAKKMALVLLLLLLMVVQNHEIVFAQPQSFTAITLSFDDNNLNQYVNAWTLMKQRGMVGTFYVVTDWIVDFHQEWEGKKLNSTHLIDLQDHGNEIGSHSKTHSKFTELTESQIRNECQLSREALESLGLSVN
ncbi:MAG: polysaccharide deacetylase family protein, partial [Candidatus Hodarchaeota archaeon]